MCDKHVVKMILESAQMLSTAHHILDKSDNDLLYKATHKNHPSSRWVRESHLHYQWLYSHFVALGLEYTRRYGKIHTSITKLSDGLSHVPRHIPNKPFSPPPQCMPPDYYQDNTIEAYRMYYKCDKASFAKWKEPAVIPEWFTEPV
tara:strand:- start:62 stop:499 length:438 start_codon:yes stop_codon:yes gene_type:complete